MTEEFSYAKYIENNSYILCVYRLTFLSSYMQLIISRRQMNRNEQKRINVYFDTREFLYHNQSGQQVDIVKNEIHMPLTMNFFFIK